MKRKIVNEISETVTLVSKNIVQVTKGFKLHLSKQIGKMMENDYRLLTRKQK